MKDSQYHKVFIPLFLAKDIIDFIILSTKFNLLQKGIGNPLGKIVILWLFIIGFAVAYPLYGYTIISFAGNAFVLFAYIILLIEANDMELTKEIFVIDNSKQKLHEEKAQLSLSLDCGSNKQKTYNHNYIIDDSFETSSNEIPCNEIPSNETPSNETPSNETPYNTTPTPNDLNINSENSFNKTSNYNYEEEIAELEEEILMYKNDKTSLESQFNSLKSENDRMTNEINNLKNENKNLLDENDTLMTNIAKIEIEIEKYKKE